MSLKQNIIYIYFKGKHQVISKSQYQYNRGQYLYFADLNLPQAFEVHFSNKDKGASKTQIGSNNLVEIPDEYFWNGALQIYAWIYLHSETNDGETIYEVKIPLSKRAKPTDEEPLPVQQSTIDRAIAELNNAVNITTENANKTDSDKIIVSNIKEDVITLKGEIDSTATTINQKAQETINASERAETSAQNAATSENNALDYSQQAKQSAQSALESKNIAQQKSEIATNASNEALGYRNEALEAKNQAIQAKQNIVDYRDETKGFRDETLILKNTVQTLKNQADETAEEIKDISDTVKEDAQSASQSASSANQSSINASQFASQAKKSADDAEESANQAEQNKNQTETFKNQSEEYKTQAGIFKSQAETFKNQAEEFKNQTETNVTHYPKIINEYWYIWDATNGEYINTNVDANGIKGDTGNGIASVTLNDDYTLTITFTDDTTYTTSSIRGQQGEQGDTGATGESGVYIGSDEPENEDVKVWIDIDDDGTSEDLVTDIAKLQETDKKIFNTYATKSVSGDIVSFDDGAEGLPLKELTIDINPIQNLRGYDSPWVGGGGKNLLDPTLLKDQAGWNTIILNLKPNTVYVLSTDYSEATLPLYFIVDNEAQGSSTKVTSDHYVRRATSETVNAKIMQRRSSGEDSFQNYHWQLEETVSGGLPTAWTPYENICPISGWTGMTVNASGKNLFGGDAWFGRGGTDDRVNRTVTGDTTAASLPLLGRLNGYKFKENTQYTLVVTMTTTSTATNKPTGLSFVYTDGTVAYLTNSAFGTAKATVAFKSSGSKTIDYIGRGSYSGTKTFYVDECGVFEGAITSDQFVPYTGQTIPISWQSEAGTVYGGTLDVLSGVLRVTHQVKTFDGSENWLQINDTRRFYVNKSLMEFDVYDSDWISNKYPFSGFKQQSNGMSIDHSFYTNYNNGSTLQERIFVFDSSFTDADAFKSSLIANPLTIYGRLKEPIEALLSPTEVRSLFGQNNIWADTGNSYVTYRVDPQKYINEQIPEIPVQDVQINDVSIVQDGVAKVPTASENNAGVVKVDVFTNGSYEGGVVTANNKLYVVGSSLNNIKSGWDYGKPIVAGNQHYATFYGLAKVSGHDEKNSELPLGQYTDEAKLSIQNMLDVPSKNDVANSLAEVANIKADVITDSASGSIASFPDGADDIPLKSLVVDINPVQDTSSGDPSPENICPISGWTGMNVQRTGKNLINADAFNVPASSSWYPLWEGNLNGTFAIRLDKSGVTNVENPDRRFLYVVCNGIVSYFNYSDEITVSGNLTKVSCIGSNAYAKVSGTVRLQIELGTTPTTFEPYNGTTITISWADEAGTVYGGKLDVLTGILTVYPYYASYNGETLTGRWVSDRDVYSVGTTPTIGAQVVNIGAEETEYQLEPHDVASLLGTNNIWADTGDVNVEYRADTKLYINKKITEALASLT